MKTNKFFKIVAVTLIAFTIGCAFVHTESLAYYSYMDDVDGSAFLQYRLKDNRGYTVTGVSNVEFGNITIPSTYNGENVYEFEAQAKSWSWVNKIVISEGVQVICSRAFAECVVQEVYLPDSLLSWGDHLFSGCGGLKIVQLPSALSAIPDGTFENCVTLSFVTIPSTVQSIGEDAFAGCEALKNITIPYGVTSIPANAFAGCGSLTTVELPSTVTSIGENAFSGCSSLKNINIPSGLKSIGANAFYGCSSLLDFAIPDSVTSIGSNAFNGCASLKKLVIPTRFTSIHKNLLEGMTSLEYLEIGKAFNSLLGFDFSQCPNLKEVKITDRIDSVKDSFKNHPSLERFYAKYLEGDTAQDFSACPKLKSFTIGGASIYLNMSFKDCSSLVEVVFENGVDYAFDPEAFSGCTSLKKLVLSGQSVIKNPTLFRYSFPSVEVLDAHSSIVESYYFDNVKDLTIQSSSSVASYMFEKCRNVENVTINGANEIGDYCFKSFPKLKTVTINSGNVNIKADAFAYCGRLETVNTYGITNVDSHAFAGCGSLKEIDLSNVVNMSNLSFGGCSNLKTIILGSNLARMANNSFESCNADIFYPLSLADFKSKVTIEQIKGSNTALPQIYYYSETMPTESGNFYHIVDGKYVKWELLTARWLNDDGSVLAEKVYAKGDTPACDLVPEKEGYLFSYWTPSMAPLNASQDYKPVFVQGLEYELNGEEYTVNGIGTYTGKSISIPDTYLGKKVTAIGDKAFYQTNIVSVSLGRYIKTLGRLCFDNCYSLGQIIVPQTNKNFCVENNFLYDINKTTLYKAAPEGVSGKYVMPSSVTTIVSGALEHCEKLTHIVLSDKLESLAGSTLGLCADLVEITIPDNINSVGSMCFFKCENLEYINFGQGVTNLTTMVADYCPKLTSVVLGSNLTKIAATPFYECPKLTDIYFMGNESQWRKVVMATKDSTIQNAALHYYSAKRPEDNELSYFCFGESGRPVLWKDIPVEVAANDPGNQQVPGSSEEQDVTASIVGEGNLKVVIGFAVGFFVAMFIFRRKKVAVSSTVADDEETSI